ncbi:Cytochrome c' [hydrothermal vent metagenome]|uniref:Cytochrome c n=1 Tax=hydrothermal vent metagenome TaxID=652676 RepID=A0A1W1C404_9ZZZZ
MKKILIGLLAFIFTNIAFANKIDDAVEYRQAAFELFQAHFAPMGAMVTGKVGFNEKEFNYNAKQLKELSDMPWRFFIEGSDMHENSHAKDEVWWKDKKDFIKNIKQFKKAVNKLNKLAKNKNSDIPAVKKAFIQTAKACKSCHKKFRQKN